MFLYHQGKDFLKFFLKGEFGYNAIPEIPICPACYFGQRLLNFNHPFASDADYI